MCGVFYAETDEVKSVMEGDSVTLNLDLTKIQRLDLLLWRFGDKGSTIAQTDGKEISYEDDEIFNGRLKLDQTGFLTITNIRTNHSGLYKAEINSNTGTSYMMFRVTVYECPSVIAGAEAEMKSVTVMEGDPVTLHVPQLQGNELLVWRFGDEGKLIAKHDIEAKSSLLYDTDERFQDRMKLDHQTGSLIITNTKTTNSGPYAVKISSNKQTLYKIFTVAVSVPGLSPGAVAGIVVVVLLLAAAAAVLGVFFYRRKTSELKNQNLKISERRNETLAISEKLKHMSKISAQLKQMTEDCEKDLPELSEHHQTLKISEKLKEISDISGQLKQMSKYCENELNKISERLKQMSSTKKEENSDVEIPLIDKAKTSEQEIDGVVSEEERQRSGMEEGERKGCIYVEKTAISQAIGELHDAEGIVRDRLGKSLIIHNTGTEHTGVCTHDLTNEVQMMDLQQSNAPITDITMVL
ncbi:hypothetical protein QQF64_034548 [Cirrhinus molitorella]|uniref:Immunoglobulin domain-containing protein n=1 Tax=Cirrhinus molitorella TaxID=172907 RepID=A0ABR3L2Q4_9TELE